ncbi:MAG: hypothetical protein ACR2J8_11920 [Thermomicrobiales bacterium]
MIHRPAAIAAIAFAVTFAGGAVVVAQNNGQYDAGVNAGDYEASSSGSDGNVVSNGSRNLPPGIARPAGSVVPGGAAPTATALAAPAPSSGTTSSGVVIPPNPALTMQHDPGAIAPVITEETTSGNSVLGPTPTAVPEAAPADTTVTADDSAGGAADRPRRTGDASASATDGTSTGGSINETIPATTGTIPTSSTNSNALPTGTSSHSSGSACGYPTWLDAQTALETQWTVDLADELDPDRDGIACEEAMH